MKKIMKEKNQVVPDENTGTRHREYHSLDYLCTRSSHGISPFFQVGRQPVP